MTRDQEQRITAALLRWFQHPQRVRRLESLGLGLAVLYLLAAATPVGYLFISHKTDDHMGNVALFFGLIATLVVMVYVIGQVCFWICSDAFETNHDCVKLLREAGLTQANTSWHISKAEQALVAWLLSSEAQQKRERRRLSL